MHLCLCVDDILRLVFRCIEDHSTLCALARTCRTFKEPAVDLIWETLTAVEPILQRLPSARFETETESVQPLAGDRWQYLVLSRPLSDDDWNIIRRLSSRVRRLNVFFNYTPPRDVMNIGVPNWFGFLASPPDPSFLFPNLRALSIEVPCSLSSIRAKNVHTETYQAVFRFFRLLIGPHLSALRFDIPSKFYAHLDISSIPALCPNLHMLSVQGFDFQRSEKTMHLLYRAVSELSRVEIVRSSVPSWHILSSLAQANALRRLSVTFPFDLGPGPGHLTGDVFPRLRALEIRASSIAQCTDLFRWIPLNQVAEMFICLASHEYRDPLQALVEMSSLISSQCQSLDFLWISISLNSSTRHVTSTWWRCMLEPYQTCHHLRVIALQVSSSLTLADNDLEDMVKAWPHLEVFHLFPDNSEDPPVQLTFRGVTALLHHCPELKDFTLMFHATPFQRVARLSNGKLVRNTSVKRMGVHTSPVSENSDVAEYLSIIMPSLKIIRLTERAHEASWSWICAQLPQKPTIHVNLPPMKLYSLLTGGTESASDEQIYGREWCWISPGSKRNRC